MKKKIAIPVDKEDILDAHFGHCSFFAVLNIENGKVVSEEKLTPPVHEPGVLPKWLSEKGVSDIIAGGMGQMAIQLFNKNGVNVFVGAPKLSAKELIEAYLNKTITFTANYCDH
ncbi:NifB/NifX family molybdenum-iron cluster-binding protein [Ancylomarina sp. 16SWW S1-10-2]|uniref:NifB/NifX family molybdenum-iron cluster-binding protein n=1 Tax=Ancylomarina sp. 16SWW S1-10-2 TaxID=2499681 RepID=UPI0012ADCA9C|nr:NifB/NifX family molybdenum-iron cluster-binding protein [Ancylomarina sp. 16SWW S1-10-2]MRT92930.1 ATPase [Ancylomarina sp. 16SWW S1-10-2]